MELESRKPEVDADADADADRDADAASCERSLQAKVERINQCAQLPLIVCSTFDTRELQS